jgi:hypothetical protein
VTYDYAYDVGRLHVLDYWLHHATRSICGEPNVALPSIGRYLDGEEEREGTYR